MKLQVKPEFAGRSASCPTCKKAMAVPALDETCVAAEGSHLNGAVSSLAKANIGGGVTLEPPADSGTTQAPVRDVLAAETRNGERYVVTNEIARGGMGSVSRAIDCDIRREVAVKYMLGQSDASKKLRFVEEAQITGQLEHPNIVPIHELGLDSQKRLFFSMKLVKGRSLGQIVEALRTEPKTAEKDYSLGRLLNIFVNICHGLAYAHARNVVHRDLKPANIMVGDFGEVYVMDWGLAKVLRSEADNALAPTGQHAAATVAVDAPSTMAATGSGSDSGAVRTNRQPTADQTQEGSILGTPVYMPPEQASGQVGTIDRRSDIYSLGAILYELLTLEPPIDRDGGAMAILMRVIQGQIVPPEQRAPKRAAAGKIPSELSAVALKALAREPKERYQTVEAMRRDVERFLEGRSVSAKTDSAREMLVKFVRRNKAFSIVTLVAMVVIAAVGGISLKINYDARLRAEAAQERAETALKQSEIDRAQRGGITEEGGRGAGGCRGRADEGSNCTGRAEDRAGPAHETDARLDPRFPPGGAPVGERAAFRRRPGTDSDRAGIRAGQSRRRVAQGQGADAQFKLRAGPG